MRSLSHTRARRSSKRVPLRAMLAACPLAPQRPAARVRLASTPRRASSVRFTAPRASAADVDAPVPYSYSTIGPVAAAKVDELLSAIAGTEAGASATAEDRRRVLALAVELESVYAQTGVRAPLHRGAALLRLLRVATRAMQRAEALRKPCALCEGEESAALPALTPLVLRSATRGRSCRCFWASTA